MQFNEYFISEMEDHVSTAIDLSSSLQEACCTMHEVWTKAIRGGGKIMFFGNGGSAADAQHIAAELVVRYKLDRAAIPAIALTTDTSVLTAVGNDFGFDQIFSRQIQALGRSGDVALGISTSGRSANVIAGLKTARDMGLVTAAFAGGDGGEFEGLANPLLVVPSSTTARIQEMHITLSHILCGALELELGVDL